MAVSWMKNGFLTRESGGAMPDPSRDLTSYVDRPFSAAVQRIAPAGLIVRLPDGREGLIRERELAWDPEKRAGWTRSYKPGDNVQVVFLRQGEGQQPELSVRLAQFDPWSDIERRYPVGALVSGTVTGIMPYGVFVELEMGVTGLLHVSRFPTWAQKPPGELFWPGDLVKVIIDTIEVRRRRIGLSMAELQTQRWNDELSPTRLPPLPTGKPIPANGSRPTVDTLLSRPPLSVLVVEDEEPQRSAVADWLRYAGQIAEVAASAEEALTMIPRLRPDLVLMDVGLPGMDGIHAVREIQARWPETRCALMTDWSRAERRAAELQPLQEAGAALLIKPMLPEDLLAVLLNAPCTPPTSREKDPASPLRLQLEQPRPLLTSTNQVGLGVLLARLLASARADKVVLFELDSESRQISVADQRGALPLRLQVLPELIHSPVRDVAEDAQVVIARNIAAETEARRFAHLKPLLDFEACLGVPVSAQLHKYYALFLFFSRAASLTDNALALSEAAAAGIGAWLERRQLLKQTADFNRIAVMGQLTRALVHEISGRVNLLNLTLQRLQAACDQVEQCIVSSPGQAGEVIRQARQELQALTQQAEALARTTRSFSRMTRPGQEEIVLLDEIIAEVVDILNDAAKAARVKIVVSLPARLHFARAQVTYLQQVLVNIVQNAIQQIHLLRPQAGGQIAIRLAQTARDGQPVLQIGVEDDGPGIHRRLWERIFEMDYTTRPDGSGLGLYMSRSLIESQGGRVFVGNSYMLWGSIFIVELPYLV